MDGVNGNLNVTDLHNVTGCGIIRKYGFVGGSVSLWGQALRLPIPRIPPSESVNFLLPSRCSTLGPAPRLPAHCHAPHHDHEGLNL